MNIIILNCAILLVTIPSVMGARCLHECLAPDPIPDPAPSCEEGWELFQGYCYILPSTTAEYDDAVNHCTNIGGNIVHISSADENTFIGEMTESELGSPFKVYIGLTDTQTEGTWRWEDDNSLVTYNNWRDGLVPSTWNQDCAGLVKEGPYEYDWIDVYCDVAREFVCEKMAA